MRRAPSFITAALLTVIASGVQAADVFVRARVVEPKLEKQTLSVSARIHKPDWYLGGESREVAGDQWTAWIDLRSWPLHDRLNREGGVAEWPVLMIALAQPGGAPIKGCTLEIALADKPDEAATVITFTEKSESDTVGFLVPHPLREKKDEFETGAQMTARHAAWANEALGGKPRRLSKFQLITALWGPYDPGLARQEAETLKSMGFNVVGGLPWEISRSLDLKSYTATWHLDPDPARSAEHWKQGDGAGIARAAQTEEGKWTQANLAHYVVADEIQVLDFRNGIDRKKLDEYFRAYLRRWSGGDDSLGTSISRVEYPLEAMFAKTLPRDADLTTRKILYYAAKFGQRWTVEQLRHTTSLVKASLPQARTETLPSDHAFFNAWGAPHVGMAYRQLDLFEIGHQQAVDIVSAEDWLGLNHMYGPSYTWTGAQAFGYLSAILRSGIGERPVSLRGLITGSDDKFLRLKAYSAIGQGAKSFFLWCYGPTYLSTENYWADLRSEYDGIAKLTAALEKTETALDVARVARDPVAVLYSVSHDIWHSDDPASFVDMRLSWCALRHLDVQPDFLREEDVEAGDLKSYKVLYVFGQCLTRKAAAAIDDWVKQGGVVYLAGGAAMRDEFYEPSSPPFAGSAWPAGAAAQLVTETGHSYNERTDLPSIKPIDMVALDTAVLGTAALDADAGETAAGAAEPAILLPVLGLKTALRSEDTTRKLASFADASAAAVQTGYGQGTVIAAGFLPGLAYGQLAHFQPMTLEEKWPDAPRNLLALPLRLAQIEPLASCDQAVVELSLLRGLKGHVLVLVNYTYQPIASLKVKLRGVGRPARAESTEGVSVQLRQLNQTDVELELPLEWTDMVLLQPK